VVPVVPVDPPVVVKEMGLVLGETEATEVEGEPETREVDGEGVAF